NSRTGAVPWFCAECGKHLANFWESSMMTACLFLVALTCLAFVPAHSQDTEQLWDSGNAFLRMCHVTDKSSGEMTSSELCFANHCISYVNGLEDGIELEMDLSHGSDHQDLFPY